MISVIIPTYKEPDYLDICLKSIFMDPSSRKNFEVVIVVDGFYDLNKTVIEKYKELEDNIKVLNLPTNQGLSVATNLGVYNSSSDTVLVVNDDNIFPSNWDTIIAENLKPKSVLSLNQIEPNPSMFPQFIIKDFGTDPNTFDVSNFQKEEILLRKDETTEEGSTLPFAINKYDYLALGGWDELYPSPHVVDWDFFLRCEYWGLKMERTYACNFYHFAGAATRKTPEQNQESSKKEAIAHGFFQNKWGCPAHHNPINNSKMLPFKKNY